MLRLRSAWLTSIIRFFAHFHADLGLPEGRGFKVLTAVNICRISGLDFRVDDRSLLRVISAVSGNWRMFFIVLG